MPEDVRLSSDQIRLIENLTVQLQCTSDQVLAEEYTETTPEHARGYLECFMSSAADDKILVAYFVLRMVMLKA